MNEYIIELSTYELPDGSGKVAVPKECKEEIVRCRDCASWFKGYCAKHTYEVVNEYGDAFTEGGFPMDADDFCSLGERKADE